MPVAHLHPRLDRALVQPAQSLPARCSRTCVRTMAVVAAPVRAKLVTDKSEEVRADLIWQWAHAVQALAHA